MNVSIRRGSLVLLMTAAYIHRNAHVFRERRGGDCSDKDVREGGEEQQMRPAGLMELSRTLQKHMTRFSAIKNTALSHCACLTTKAQLCATVSEASWMKQDTTNETTLGRSTSRHHNTFAAWRCTDTFCTSWLRRNPRASRKGNLQTLHEQRDARL